MIEAINNKEELIALLNEHATLIQEIQSKVGGPITDKIEEEVPNVSDEAQDKIAEGEAKETADNSMKLDEVARLLGEE